MASIEDSKYFKKSSSEILRYLNDLSQSLISTSADELLQALPEKVCDLLSVPICILWNKEQDKPKFKVIATYGEVDDKYKRIEMDLGHPGVQYILNRDKVLSLVNVNEATFRLADIDELNKRRWISFLSIPLKIESEIVGILDVFTKDTRHFNNSEKNLFNILANFASLCIQKKYFVKGKKEIYDDREKLQDLTAIMLEMTATSEANEVWSLLRKGALKLVGSKPRIWIGRLNHQNGKFESVELNNTSELEFGIGITNKALIEGKTIIANDVLSDEWSKTYHKRWSDTRSQMSVPILIDKVPIRENLEVKTGSKRIGILNIESSKIDNFPETYQKRLLLLARHTALRLERIEFYNKLVAIREIEREITKAQNFDEIIKIVIKGITTILEFTWVNISLINSDRTSIKSDYISGLPKDKKEEFKKMALHNLDSDDIQANIVRNKQIKVPDNDDPGLDKEIFKKFGHEDIIRVFIPMIEPLNNLVIGTVEAGYKREYRQHIYEQDVQILKGFVEHAVHAIERRKSGLIDRITHELKSPVVGIRSHASFLQRRFSDINLAPSTIAIKFEDILTDCDLLLYQIRQIEYFLGRSYSEKPKVESVIVFRDIVVKTVNQLKPILNEYGLHVKGVRYEFGDAARMAILTDKVMLNQVIYNLLINAIKYAEKNPGQFKILLEASEYKENLMIKFKDWGIGIVEDDVNKIFEEGFRSLDAIKKVGGSGLGLSISIAIIQQLGGSLKLVNNSKPTEFHLILPKIFKEAPNDSFR
ncbi:MULTISPECIES: GAF domain-containing sensor histidine kinase [unclassified Nostoc]|uniref:sensor histidine kinase n=1 Tax=unclassified Nostoc TaxID=2593658 RepID=UPI0025AA346B|nr:MULTISPECIES: GAF domain-containing sensor histidine kinase [unclassified Nostoc]MDM9581451.1 GAF domain-containing sensor histidine kinase [Nostoc sp. GT001]MDZ7948322.1 GAF domain-containing sensor histidine kinase [Nostoc sp. EfeVER01]MDZ7994986.1 GAF domain-containing sensor histidine kinase [Nostoc sp. EspVER01]